ncbi:MAG: hypothetical protein MJ173_09245 [Clostridia bacterium]|nr:hypothetical protein [Clostridia bacterium]
MKKSIKAMALIAVIAVFVVFALGSGSKTDENGQTGSGEIVEAEKEAIKEAMAAEVTAEPTTLAPQPTSFTLGDTFTFDGFELTIGTTASFTSVQNQFSELNGKPVVRIPVKLKNVSSETKGFSMFNMKYFGSQGTEISGCSTYFQEDCIEWSGKLRPNASKDVAMYFVYDGDGIYGVDFDDFSNKVSVEFKIKK